MSKKDRESMEELWSKRFDEEVDYNEEQTMSRKAKREREKSISPILTVTVIFLVLVIVVTLGTYVWYSNHEANYNEPQSTTVAEKNDNADTSEDTKEEPKKDEPKDEEPEKAPEEPEKAPEEPKVEEQPEKKQTEETDQSPEAATETYVVKAGDNMYRIALNHGMTTEELMKLNGLSDESVYVGQKLNVQ